MSALDAISFYDLVGRPFIDGGRDPQKGLDCWGLVLEVFRRSGIDLPDYTIACDDIPGIGRAVESERSFGRWKRWEAHEAPIPSLLAIRFNSPLIINHTGVFIGAGRFLHTRKRVGVCVETISSPAWKHRIEGFYTPEFGRF